MSAFLGELLRCIDHRDSLLRKAVIEQRNNFFLPAVYTSSSKSICLKNYVEDLRITFRIDHRDMNRQVR